MKRAWALLCLACLPACFPDYDVVVERPAAGSAGMGATGSAGMGATGGMGGTNNPPEPSCNDGQKNGDETGEDCGMDACGVGCDPGEGCLGDIDCKVGLCARNVCQAASCNDRLLNGDETDQDCGGDMGCDRCTPGQRCKMASDCDGGACVSGQCKAPTCKDEILNGDETDQDCGGSCSTKCAVGQGCSITGDCDALACSKDKCQAASCEDGILNQDESAKDCGGSCSVCQDGATCRAGTDCESGVCGSNKQCSKATCSDGVRNGKEPSKDCGIDCPNKCATLELCNVTNDCQATLSCTSGHCLPAPGGKALSPLNWIATAQYELAGARAPKAIDGIDNTNYISGHEQTIGIWFQLDMIKTQFVYGLELDCNDAASCNDPLAGNNDLPAAINVTFSDIDSDAAWAAAEPILKDHVVTPHDKVSLPQVGIGRFMRITLSAGKNRWWRMDELRVMQ